jgi:hypothetical protein
MANSDIQRRPKHEVAPAGRYLHGFIITGESGRNYKISFDTSQMCWVCSCPGCIRHGQCKHLTACGLSGRKFGKMKKIPTSSEVQKMLPPGSEMTG